MLRLRSYLFMSTGIAFLLAPLNTVRSQSLEFHGQAIAWATLHPAEPLQMQGGLRYIPELQISLPLGPYSLDAEVSGNLWGSATYMEDSIFLDEDLSFYRAWLRFSGNQFELRAGLQKINFGSAQLFRPLMWFDRIDPRDPLQLTDGVWGLLGRYYFMNNANIWLWALYGQDEVKGWELIPSKNKSMEYGGRIQLPLYTGEIGATYHHRTADPGPVLPDSISGGQTSPEHRIALDLKMDLVLGLWAEASLIRQAFEFTPLNYTSMINLGADYTFGLGNGLGVMAESFWYLRGADPFGSEETLSFGLLSATYPLNIVHSLNAMLFYDFSNKEFYRFVNWSMSYDRWAFYVMAFWNPESYSLYNVDPRTSLYGGWGFQLMAVFNH